MLITALINVFSSTGWGSTYLPTLQLITSTSMCSHPPAKSHTTWSISSFQGPFVLWLWVLRTRNSLFLTPLTLIIAVWNVHLLFFCCCLFSLQEEYLQKHLKHKAPPDQSGSGSCIWLLWASSSKTGLCIIAEEQQPSRRRRSHMERMLLQEHCAVVVFTHSNDKEHYLEIESIEYV